MAPSSPSPWRYFPTAPRWSATPSAPRRQAKSKTTGRVYDKLFARHWDTWKDGKRSHVFVVPVAGGTPVDVMKGMDADSPTKPFGGSEDFTFTPDSQGVVFTARDAGRQESWSTDLDLFLAPADGKSAPRKLTASNRATDTLPVFSPDGKTLAYLAMERPGYEADRLRVILRTWPAGQERVLTEKWDRSAGSLAWSADGKTLFTSTYSEGQHPAFAIDVASGQVRTLIAARLCVGRAARRRGPHRLQLRHAEGARGPVLRQGGRHGRAPAHPGEPGGAGLHPLRRVRALHLRRAGTTRRSSAT